MAFAVKIFLLGVTKLSLPTKLVDATNPALVGVTTLGFFKGSKVARDVKKKIFVPETELEVLEEEFLSSSADRSSL